MGALIPGALVVLIFMALYGAAWAAGGGRRKTRWALIACALLLLCTPAVYEFSIDDQYSTMVNVADDGTYVECPLGAWELGGNRIFNLPAGASYAQGEVTSLTDNPKVRHLKYYVPVKLVNLALYLKKKSERWEKRSVSAIQAEMNLAAQFYLYEFSNGHSKALAGFYNPLDSKQVEALEGLLLPWLNARLATEGLEAIKGVEFSVN